MGVSTDWAHYLQIKEAEVSESRHPHIGCDENANGVVHLARSHRAEVKRARNGSACIIL